MSHRLQTSQPVLGKNGMMFFLIIISAFPPLTIDLYLPALPEMTHIFNTQQALVNLTLSGYFVTYAVGLLIWGPLSEKFGRKPILLSGLFIYMIASLCCSLAGNIEQLIAARVLQALGGSAVTVVSTSIVKDLYSGRERERVMATIMSLVTIAPMVAPVLGAFILQVASWRIVFVALAIFGAFATLLALCYKETLVIRYTGSILYSWGRLAVVIKNRHFVILLAIFSITPMAMMAFLAAGSYIYINDFGLTEQQFSYAFAFNALCASFGPTMYIKISRHVQVTKLITYSFLLLSCAGVLTLTVAHLSPWFFAFICAPATLTVIMVRVPGMNLMLDQQEHDTGSAVALIQFFGMISGSIGMVLVSLKPDSLINNLGVIQLCVGLLGGALWLMARHRPFVTEKLPK